MIVLRSKDDKLFMKNVTNSFISLSLLFNFIKTNDLLLDSLEKVYLILFLIKITYFYLLRLEFFNIICLYTQLKKNRKHDHKLPTYFLSFNLHQEWELVRPTQRKMNINSFMSSRK